MATTACEVQRPSSRADIVVTAPGLTVVIEAKVDAAEGERQCDRTYEDWCHEGDVVFVFLTKDGRDLDKESADATKDAFRTLSFVAVREELEKLRASLDTDDPPPRGLAALHTYLQTLRAEFP